jgi:integrase
MFQGGKETMARRGNGEGSIYQRKTDGKWVGSVTLEGGNRKVFYGKTRKEVKDKLTTALYEQQQGTAVKTSQLTVGRFITDWLENTHKRQIRLRTYERYKESVDLHIIPVLGNIQLQKLQVQHLQSFYTKKEKEGLSSTTILGYHHVLHKALDTAVEWGLIVRNVCDIASPPRRARFEIQPLTVEQAQKLLSTVHGHKWEALFTIALATGMRRGEILGLKWQDINFATGTLQVRRILSRVPTQTPERDHVYIEAEPKTQKSRRSITIAPFALDVLKQHRIQQMEAKLRAGPKWQEHDYVFPSSIGTYLNPNNVVKEFKKLLKQADLPDIRFHDLRHSAASLLLSAGVHPKIVQEILGHTQISMTLDIYSHILPGMQQDAMSKLHETLSGGKDEDDEDDGMAGISGSRKPKKR